MAFELAPRDPEPGEPESSGRESSAPEPKARELQPQRTEVGRKRYVCPYLGLSQDRTVIAASPTLAHACYAQDRRIAPSLEHQRARCFSETYPKCTYYPDKVVGKDSDKIGSTSGDRDVIQTPGVYALKEKVEPRRRNRLPWLIVLLILLLLAALAYAYVNGMIPAAWLSALPQIGTFAPAPTSVSGASTPVALTTESSSTSSGTTSSGTTSSGTTSSGTTSSGTTPSATTSSDGTPAAATSSDSTPSATSTSSGTTPAASSSSGSTPTPVAAALASATPTPSRQQANASGSSATQSTPGASNTTAATNTPGDLASATPTADVDGQELRLNPREVDVNWWVSNESQRNIGDSFLYSGFLDQMVYVSAVRFDLRRIPRGSPILEATLSLTGLRDNRLDRNSEVNWSVQLIAENDLADSSSVDFATIFGAPASITLLPQLQTSDVAPGLTNQWVFDQSARDWLFQQVLDGATSVTVRISPFPVSDDTLFAWDSGYGSESDGAIPQLVFELGPPPPTPPPTPTHPVIVATLTPEPENVLTVVARSPTATITAPQSAFATNTPEPTFEVVTPTPLPQNLETVQAAAIAEELPPVVRHTPVPANAATATTDARFATAVALTTGTFTPVPTNYVTPALYFPSPPAENISTAEARSLAATAVAGIPTATLPWNAVPAVYAYATATPANRATAIALIEMENSIAATTGTPTPTPWNLVVITAVPPPTPTPIPLVVSSTDMEPTPTPTATRVLTTEDFARFQNKILFQSDRSGDTQTWILDPETEKVVGYITDNRVYLQARDNFLTYSPDRKKQALVEPDGRGDLQIMALDLEYGGKSKITTLDYAISYDPAWSPNGQTIAFVSTDTGGDEIYVVSPEGQNLQRLTFNTWEWDKHPTWSPDSTRIVFFSNRDTGRRQIWMMNADGSNQHNISNSEFDDWDPVWVR